MSPSRYGRETVVDLLQGHFGVHTAYVEMISHAWNGEPLIHRVWIHSSSSHFRTASRLLLLASVSVPPSMDVSISS